MTNHPPPPRRGVASPARRLAAANGERTPDGRGRNRDMIWQKRLVVSHACAKPKVRRWVDGWADGEEKNDAAGADRPDRTREEASGRDGAAPCSVHEQNADPTGRRAPAPGPALLPLSSLVAASWLNTQLERVQGVGFERKGQRDCASVRAPLAGRKSRAAAFSPAYRRTACYTTRSSTCARSVSCGKTKGTDAVTVIRLL